MDVGLGVGFGVGLGVGFAEVGLEVGLGVGLDVGEGVFGVGGDVGCVLLDCVHHDHKYKNKQVSN